MKPKVFFDIVIGSTAVGRVIFELFGDVTPKTVENFRGLCTGEYGYGKIFKKKLYYKGSRFHKIEEDQYIEGGDFVYGNGSGGESIYGEFFKDENFQNRHSCAGLLSMANNGRNMNSSKFFITLKPCPHLDGSHVVFGQVIEGMEIIRQMGRVPTDAKGKPRTRISIFDCGDMDTRRLHYIEDTFKEAMEAIMKDREVVEKIKTLDYEEAEQYKKQKKNSAFNQLQQYESEEDESGIKEEKKVSLLEEERLELNEDEEEAEENKMRERMGEDKFNKYMDLKSKINVAKNLNIEAVKEENLKFQDPHWEKKMSQKEYMKMRNLQKDRLIEQGVPEEKLYTQDTINKCEFKNKKDIKKLKNSSFGWDVFNTDSLYRAYKKRLVTMPFDKTLYEKQMEDPSIALETSDERKNLLIADTIEQQLNRKTRSRRRAFAEEKDIDYINDRNRHFNKKIQRYFEKNSTEIKANLERGTAL
jgi:peptidyl-prolyl isomerase G (cyclophilin G)